MELRDVMRASPLLAILRNVPLEDTVAYARAVYEGGVDFFEVAMNSPYAARQIALLREAFGERCRIGGGTAITVARAQQAMEAGAQFLLTPATDASVLAYCRDHGVPLLPGVMTPHDVVECLSYGFSTCKLFPAGEVPRSYVKSLKGPFDDVEFMAIGGVTPENAEEFFRAGCLSVGMGSNLMPKQALREKDWAACTASVRHTWELCRQAAEKNRPEGKVK